MAVFDKHVVPHGKIVPPKKAFMLSLNDAIIEWLQQNWPALDCCSGRISYKYGGKHVICISVEGRLCRPADGLPDVLLPADPEFFDKFNHVIHVITAIHETEKAINA